MRGVWNNRCEAPGVNVSVDHCVSVQRERSVFARCLDCSMALMQPLAGNGYELVIDWMLTHRCRDTEACPAIPPNEDTNDGRHD